MKLFTHPPEVYWRAYHRRRYRRLSQTPSEEQICLNCGTTYHGNFCPVCGQNHQVKSLTFIHLLRNFWLSLITLRKGYALTLIELTGHPGCFMQRYINGHRLPYIHPFRLLLVLLTIYVLFSMTFMAGQLPHEQSFGFTDYLQSVRTGDWRETIAGYLIAVLQFVHETPLLQMAATRFKKWFFQNPAYLAVTLFPFFAALSYILFHSEKMHRQEEGKNDKDNSTEEEDKTPSLFETAVKEPFHPLWELLRIFFHRKVSRRIAAGKAKIAAWWIKNFGKPIPLLKAVHFLSKIMRDGFHLLKEGLRKIQTKKNKVQPLTYNFIEVLYMRGYITCLLMEVNLLLFFWGLSVTPFNIWVMAGTAAIYKSFFRWPWWNTIKQTIWMYCLTFFLMGICCMIAAIRTVIYE